MIRIYKENYKHLPKRFVNKIDSDINFIIHENGKNGHVYSKRDAFCLETQVEPNAINVEGFHSPILNAGEQYDSVTSYRFYIKK